MLRSQLRLGAAGCPLVVDARGDSAPLFYGHTPADDALGARETDILSADAWTDNTRVNAVIRVAELPVPPLAPRTHGYQWELRLRAEGGTITLLASENNGDWVYNSVWETLVGGQSTGHRGRLDGEPAQHGRAVGRESR